MNLEVGKIGLAKIKKLSKLHKKTFKKFCLDFWENCYLVNFKYQNPKIIEAFFYNWLYVQSEQFTSEFNTMMQLWTNIELKYKLSNIFSIALFLEVLIRSIQVSLDLMYVKCMMLENRMPKFVDDFSEFLNNGRRGDEQLKKWEDSTRLERFITHFRVDIGQSQRIEADMQTE